jgi:hypothetical protein
VSLHLDAHDVLTGVMTTQITLDLSASGDAWTGQFTFTAADRRATLQDASGSPHATRIPV